MPVQRDMSERGSTCERRVTGVERATDGLGSGDKRKVRVR